MNIVFNFIFSGNNGYLSFNIDCYYLKASTIVNNLTACLIFIKYHIYIHNFIGKIFFKVLFFCSNLYQCFLISIHFSLVFKLVSILSITNLQFAFTFFTMAGIFRKKFIIWFTKRKRQNRKIVPWFFQHSFGES